VEREQGHVASATELLEESLAIRQEIRDRNGGGVGRIELAHTLHVAGDLESAKRAAVEAASIFRETALKQGEAQALHTLGDIALSEGDLALARNRHEAALTLRLELTEKRTVVESRVSLGAVCLEEGRIGESEKFLREVIDELDLEMTGPAGAIARVFLARALLAQRRNREASEALLRARGIAAETRRMAILLEIAVTEARVDAAMGRAEAALRNLAEMLETATRNGAGLYEFAARLALGEIELEYGDAAAGRTRLAALRDDAARKGFGLIAAQAGAALSRVSS
jgi:tetratricopeptide (TPR) repeat protein